MLFEQLVPRTRASVSSLTLVFASLVGLGIIYAQTISSLAFAWNQDEFSHGILIPFISLMWALRLLQQDKPTPKPESAGAVLLFVGILMKFAGELVANNWLSEISLIVSLTGLLALFFGFSVVKRLAAPIVFLFFAIPLPVTVTPLLTAKMQLLSSDLGVAGLQALGIPVYQEGNVIDLGTHKLQVAEACSGLRYVFPLMSLGYLLAFHAFKTSWKRLAVFLATIPIAILMNGIRITLTGIAVDSAGVWLIEGTLHEMEGFIVFAFCLLFLALVIWGINKISHADESSDPVFPVLKAPLWADAPEFPAAKARLGFLIVLLSMGVSFAVDSRAGDVIPERRDFADFPLHIGDWRGESATLSKEESQTLRLTDYLLANYSMGEGSLPVTFYVAYYDSQRQGHSIHSPQVCLPGSGWEIVSRDVAFIDVQKEAPLAVNREIIQRGSEKELVYYWFRESGNDAATNFDAKWQMMRSAFRSGRTDGSLIRLTTPIMGTETTEDAEHLLNDFLRTALPLLPPYLPN